MAASSSFKPNPLSLSVPDPALDRWLRDSGYLDLLDSTTTGAPSSASAPSTSASVAASPGAGPVSSGVAADVLAFARTLASLLALNPFARLSTADLAAPTPSWSLAFVGPPGAASYSWPPTPTQARLRVQENVRRYARNYAALTILVFACCLYVFSTVYVLFLIPSLSLILEAAPLMNDHLCQHWAGIGCRWRCWGCWPASPSGRACATAVTIGASPPGLQGLPRLCCTARRLVTMMFLPTQHFD